MPENTKKQPVTEAPYAPRRLGFREQAILTVKLLLAAGGILGRLALLERMVAE